MFSFKIMIYQNDVKLAYDPEKRVRAPGWGRDSLSELATLPHARSWMAPIWRMGECAGKPPCEWCSGDEWE